MIRISRKIVPKGFAAITLWPYIFIADEKYIDRDELISHELVHLRQQLEMTPILFYLWYGIEFLIKLIKYKDKTLAYRNLSFEREARLSKKSLSHFEDRKSFEWLGHL